MAVALQATFLDIWRTTNDPDRSAAEKRDRITGAVSAWLDGPALSHDALGPLRALFDPELQAEFEDAYVEYVTARLVGRFARHAQRPVQIEEARYDTERDRIEVAARGAATDLGLRGVGLRHSATSQPIELRMWLRQQSGSWRIIALHLDGVSMSRNFRDQFEAVLERSDPPSLVQDLRVRNERSRESNPFDP